MTYQATYSAATLAYCWRCPKRNIYALAASGAMPRIRANGSMRFRGSDMSNFEFTSPLIARGASSGSVVQAVASRVARTIKPRRALHLDCAPYFLRQRMWHR